MGKCNVLRLSALAASWNGQAIIPSSPSDYTNDLVQIHYNSMGATMQDGREGKALHVVHITMPGGVQVEVNRWNEPGEGSYINVRITMPAQPGQDGHCGNFNGNPADDGTCGHDGGGCWRVVFPHEDCRCSGESARHQQLPCSPVGFSQRLMQEEGAQIYSINVLPS